MKCVWWCVLAAMLVSGTSAMEEMNDALMDMIHSHMREGKYDKSTIKAARIVTPDDVGYTLYTRNGTFPLRHQEDAPMFNRSVSTKVLVHGFLSAPKIFLPAKDAYLREADFNVILVDWSRPARCWHDSKAAAVLALCYGTATEIHVGVVGALLGEQLSHLQPVDAHLVGHSLGAHVAGVAAARYHVKRVTGLDPAAPLIDSSRPELRLDASDADFVDVIHTSVGTFGWTNALGHADFFPNGGGTPQPGCGFFKDLLKTCSHARAHQYFTESISELGQLQFNATPCGRGRSFSQSACSQEDETVMGEHVSRSARGLYFVRTGEHNPYAVVSSAIQTTAAYVWLVLSCTSVMWR